MAYSSSPASLATIFSQLLSLTLLLALTRAQPSDTAGCGSLLLRLAPCAPYVQGLAAAPVDACCDNLVNVYGERPKCLCPLLNQSTSLPINRTLLLQLPLLCHLDVTTAASTCPGFSLPPGSQAVEGSSTNTSTAVTPAMAPRTNNILFGLNSGGNPRVEGAPLALVVMLLVSAIAC